MIRLVHESQFKRMLDKHGVKFISTGDEGVAMWEVNGEDYLILIEPVNADGYCPFQVGALLHLIEHGIPHLPVNDHEEDAADAHVSGLGPKDFNIIKLPKKS